MPHYKISTKAFPELKNLIRTFKRFMWKEFDGYMVGKTHFYAHSEGDAGWFTKQFLDAKKGKGLYADFFK